MRAKKGIAVTLVLGLVGVASDRARAQDEPDEKQQAMEAVLGALKDVAGRFPEERRRALSSGALNAMHAAERFDRIRFKGHPSPPERLAPEAVELLLGPAPLGFVSDPSSDLILSRVAGFTQSETSTAWCGNTAVVGFNDSGSFLETAIIPGIGFSFNGVSRSGNRGTSFVDLGFLNPGPNVNNFLIGDPVLVCANANTFYYASLFQTFTPPANLGTAISVSRSFNGGLIWGNPIPAASKDGFTHFLDKPWLAINSSGHLFVTYTDFDDSGTAPPAGCGTTPTGRPIPRTAIELVRSTNAGSTWSAPVVIASVCGAPFVQGSQVAVGPIGEVYVAWELFADDFVTRRHSIKKSTDNGMTFGTTVTVSNVACIGGCFTLRGGFRSAFEFSSLAVDRSGTATNGHVYLAWPDGRNLQVPDIDSFSGFYGFADILVSKSTNMGMTWSAPVKVNSNVEPLPSGEGSDQFQPGIGVDRAGRLAACWYDRRRDPSNFRIDRWCASSTDGGASWANVRKTNRPFSPFHATDFEINPLYMGDYDSLVSDFTRANGGFLGAYQVISSRGNPDLKSNRVP